MHAQDRSYYYYWYGNNGNGNGNGAYVSRNHCQDYNGWAVAVGAISTAFCLIFAIMTCWYVQFTTASAAAMLTQRQAVDSLPARHHGSFVGSRSGTL